MQLLSASSADDTILAAVCKKQYSVAVATIYLSIIIKTKEAYLVPCTDKTSEWDYRQHSGIECLVNCNIINLQRCYSLHHNR